MTVRVPVNILAACHSGSGSGSSSAYGSTDAPSFGTSSTAEQVDLEPAEQVEARSSVELLRAFGFEISCGISF